VNRANNANASVGAVNQVAQAGFRFRNRASLNASKIGAVKGSLEVENEEPINGDVSLPSTDELKTRIFDVFATQNRAVTSQDYKAVVYSMPGRYGAIKRCNIVQDTNSFKRNLNLYVIANLPSGQLVAATDTLKRNLKTWINKNRMINDTVDILDAKIVNIQIDFEISANLDFDKEEALHNAIGRLRKHFSVKMDVGENLVISEIRNQLNKVRGISDVNNVTIRNVTSGGYSSVHYDTESNTSVDGKVLFCPKNVIFELKRPFKDIRGTVK